MSLGVNVSDTWVAYTLSKEEAHAVHGPRSR